MDWASGQLTHPKSAVYRERAESHVNIIAKALKIPRLSTNFSLNSLIN